MRKRRITPVIVFGIIIAVVSVFFGSWLFDRYKIRKEYEAAKANAQKTATYVPETLSSSGSAADEASSSGEQGEISREEMEKKLDEAGITIDSEGRLGLKGVDTDLLLKNLGSTTAGSEKAGYETKGKIRNIECKKTEDGKVVYTVDGKETTERPDLFKEKELIYNGVHYKRNTAVKAWLILGVDNRGSLQIDRKISEIGLSDGIFLLAEDTAKNKVHIIQVPRDTMTTITVTDKNSDPVGSRVDHLTRAWMYGDNHAKSGKYAVDAVSEVFGGLKINGYMAGSIDVIKELNDYVGGVEVTIEEDGLQTADPDFIKGKTVTLMGDQAEKFVRSRDVNVDFSAMTRMHRHRQYIIAFEKKLKSLQKKDSDTIPGLFSIIEDNIVTDMAKGTYLKIALDLVMKDGSVGMDDFSTFEGENVVNKEENLDEFWPDYENVDRLTLKHFFREI